MVASLLWADLTADQLVSIQRPPRKDLTPRDVLAHLTCLDASDDRDVVLLDLYAHTMQFAQARTMSADQTSTLFSIVKEVHRRAVAERLDIAAAFRCLSELMVAHSVQRPPFSLGIFTPTLLSAVSEWMLTSYFRHYKLYQYAFTPRVTLQATSQHPRDRVELPPLLPPLSDALSHDEYQRLLEAARQQAEAQAAAAAAAAAHEEAVLKARRALDEYEASIPPDIKDRVAEAVEKQMVSVRQALLEEHTAAAAARATQAAEQGTRDAANAAEEAARAAVAAAKAAAAAAAAAATAAPAK